MDLISTHQSADFDALASMLAARRLYPGAQLFFPGSRERSVRRMLDSELITLEEVRQRHVEPERLERIILCDCRRRDRLGIIPRWLDERPEIEVLAYDHHTASEDDVPFTGGIVDPAVGATATLLVEELGRRGIGLARHEATVMLMGIYEDTGSLSYETVTARDLAATARLLEMGGELSLVRRFALNVLDPGRLDLLHSMSEALEVRRLAGHRVGVVALELGGYVDELAPLVSRTVEIFDLPLLFALFGEGDGVTVIARGDLPGVDLGELLAGFADGGGGHATAASARLKQQGSASAVRDRLLSYLDRALPALPRAADLMLADFYRVQIDATVAETKRRLNRWRVNAVPVLDGERVVGAVTRQLIDAALDHELGDRPVAKVMTGELEWVAPGAPADTVSEAIFTRHPRFVLVGDRATGRAEGLVTRMELLRRLHAVLPRGLTGGRPPRGVEARDVEARGVEARGVEARGVEPSSAIPPERLGALLRDRLAPQVAGRVAAAARVARRDGVSAHLVGGLVRDLLLGRRNRDLDLVVVGDGLAFARRLAAEIDGRVHEHRPFLTAVVVAPDGFHIDIATARSEFYRTPAALPEVEASGLRQDLYRRDFTVNTLAIALGPEPEPRLADFFGGMQDLDARTLRVLHSLSFIDDPTRVLRAVRLEQRLDFRMSADTLRLVRIARDEGIFEQLSASRLHQELVALLADRQTALGGIERLAELELLGILHPRLALTRPVRRRLAGVGEALAWWSEQEIGEPAVAGWLVYLLALADDLPPAARRELAARLDLGKGERQLFLAAGRRCAAAAAVLAADGVPPHRVHDALEPLSGEELALLLAGGAEVAEWVRRDLVELRRLSIPVRGADLVERGIEPGPIIGRALKAAHDARLDGIIEAGEELEHALAAAGTAVTEGTAVTAGKAGGEDG